MAAGLDNVLVVDDEPMVREVVTRYLERDGFRVYAAADGDAALAWLADHRPDLVVLDLMLPAVVDLTEIADEAIEALTPVATRNEVTLQLEASSRVRVTGNAAALGRVIRNLLDNAIRHTPSRSTIVVEVGLDGRATLRVRDDGPGFPDEFSREAFASFSRADRSRNRNTGGSGLGLAIARGLVEAHGGRIWIESPPGGRVAFELPEPVSPGQDG